MEEKLEQKCELCEEKATNICFDCSFLLCDSCFNFLHEKHSNIGHKKENIGPLINLNIKCPVHPKMPLTLFCDKEKSNKYVI